VKQNDAPARLIGVAAIKRIAPLVVLMLGCACTSTPGSSSVGHGPPPVALPVSLRSAAPRVDCPVSTIRASEVSTSKLSRLMKGHVPTWVPPGFGLVEAFGPYLGFGQHVPGGGAVWVTTDCRTIEISAYRAADVSRSWSTDGAAKGEGACANAVLGRASCWTILAPGAGQRITVQTMGLSIRQTAHILQSMRPLSGRGSLCPARITGEKPKSSAVPGADEQVVPGAPVTLQLCSYSGLSKHPARSRRLIRAKAVSGDEQIHKLAAALNHLKRVRRGTVLDCPRDTGAADLLRFSYGDGSWVDVVMPTSGCQIANNGRSAWFTTLTIWRLIERIEGGP
jgi:hypothetical protein